MTPRRHRRRTSLLRTAAVAAFGAAAALALAGLVLDSAGGLRVAVATGAVLVGLLAAALLRSERALPAAVGAARARQATGFTAAQQRLLADQRRVVEHLGRRLADTERRAAALAATVTTLQAQATEPSDTLAVRPTSQLALADLWPDLAEAPTVVDLLGWDQAAYAAAAEDVERRSA